MNKKDKEKLTMKALEELLEKIETDIRRARLLIHQLITWDFSSTSETEFKNLAEKFATYQEGDEVKVIEWVFDWYFMQWSDWKKYPVPLNYASKSKLIPGDVLKLRIMKDWKLVYKLIWPAPRKYVKATLSKTDDNKYIAITDDGKTYFLNLAAVTYFKWKPWDELSIIVNADWKWDFAAIEALLPSENIDNNEKA